MSFKIAPGLTLPLEAVTQTFGILAKRGVGKTYTALVLVEEMLKANAQVVVVDPVGVCYGLRSSADGKRAGLPITVLGGEHGDVPLESTAGETIANFIIEEKQSAILDLALFRKNERQRFITDFAERLYLKNRTALHLVLDEADSFAPQRPMPGEQRMLGAIQDIVRRGRARGLGVTLVTQRAAVLSKDVLTQVEVLVALRTLSPQDRKAVEAWILAHDVEGKRGEFMGSLADLPIGTAWFWSPGWLDIFKRVKVRKRETFDSSATPKAGRRVAAGPKRLAKIDLQALEARIAATIERAKESDPKELRRRIAELERKVATTPTKTRTVEVPIVKESELKRLEKLAERASAAVSSFSESIEQLLSDVQKRAELPVPRPSPSRPRVAEQILRPRSLQRPRQAVNRGDKTTLGKGEQIILSAIAQHAEGVTRNQLTVLTGYKRSTRDAYLQRLRVPGYIDVRGERIFATDAGVAALGPDFEPLPTGDALRRHWYDNLPSGERAVFVAITNAYPEAIRRDELDVDYQRSTRDAYLQRLSARKLIETPSPGMVRASEELF